MNFNPQKKNDKAEQNFDKLIIKELWLITSYLNQIPKEGKGLQFLHQAIVDLIYYQQDQSEKDRVILASLSGKINKLDLFDLEQLTVVRNYDNFKRTEKSISFYIIETINQLQEEAKPQMIKK